MILVGVQQFTPEQLCSLFGIYCSALLYSEQVLFIAG